MNYEKQRKRMVDEQLIPRGISDPKVLKAFMSVQRHRFVPAPLDIASYEDRPLPIGEEQTISQPYMVAIMTESLRLKGGEKVLEVGTGSGYQAAILAQICGRVCTIEREERLFQRAKTLLLEEGYKNIEFACGDGTKGWEDAAPFEGIVVTAAAPFVPEALKKQLAEGGRLVIPVGTMYSQMLMAIEKKGNDFITENICGCVFVPLLGEYGWKG
ncbi:MAG: protein-L-isoaspartate(D-aspartate) O-methyltransferase [Candidatus Omnitrophota bacterium]